VDQTGNPAIDDLLLEPLVIEDGLLRLPDAPGLGITLNPATIDRLAMPRDHTMPDGNYSDLIFGPQYWSTAPAFETQQQ
jgi:hypothetical protein